jgi:tetratricopeptide (TPR) repeat protein
MGRVRVLRSYWQITAVAAGVIIAGGAGAIVKWPHGWWWLVVVTAAAAAMAPLVLAALSEASQRRREVARTARSALQEMTGTDGSVLPRAENAELEARVHHMVLALPYIHRDEEETIRAHLRAGHPVLLIGTSMVGKTKMAARVIAEEFGSWPVAIPDSKTALADLDAKDISLHDSVVWLDDIDRLIGVGGITDGALRRLVAAGNIVVATIRTGTYEQFRPSSQLRPLEWDVLRIFEHVFVSRDLSEKEKERLATAVEDPGIRDRIDAVGLGEYVGAAGQVTETLKLGATKPDNLGFALVLGAADWRRCGMNRPVPVSVLASLAKSHLDQRRQPRLADQEAFDAALSWATREISPGVSLLHSVGKHSYVIYDYALDLISAEAISIPDTNWTVIISVADDSDLIRLGYTANAYDDLADATREAFAKAAISGHLGAAPMAAFSLGSQLEKQGKPEGAKSSFRRAIDSGYAPAAPMAAISLGILLQSEGDAAGAEATLRQAIDSEDSYLAAKAASNLGAVLEGKGDTAGAETAFRQAIDSGDADIAATAAANLGVLLQRKGDTEGAKTAYRQAIGFGAASMAAFGLGYCWRTKGIPRAPRQPSSRPSTRETLRRHPWPHSAWDWFCTGQGTP